MTGELADISQYIDNGVLVLPPNLVNYPSSIMLSDINELVSLGNLETVNGGIYIWNCQNLVSLGDVKRINGPLDCAICPNLIDINHLVRAVGYLQLSDTKVQSLNSNFKLEKIAPNIRTSVYLPEEHKYKMAV